MKNGNAIATISALLVIAILVGIPSRSRANPETRQSSVPSAKLSGSAGTKKRPPFYVNFMLTGSMLHEDSNHRLTSYESNALATPGLALRAGAVISDSHLVGGLFQTNWRATQKVVDSRGGDNAWGEVANVYVGSEYRFQWVSGFYAGVSLGFVYTFADNDIAGSEEHEPECNTRDCLEDYLRRSDDSGVPGFAVRGAVGYEYRIKRNFALNIEGFAGVFAGENEHNAHLTMPTYGLAIGIGI